VRNEPQRNFMPWLTHAQYRSMCYLEWTRLQCLNLQASGYSRKRNVHPCHPNQLLFYRPTSRASHPCYPGRFERKLTGYKEEKKKNNVSTTYPLWSLHSWKRTLSYLTNSLQRLPLRENTDKSIRDPTTLDCKVRLHDRNVPEKQIYQKARIWV